MNITVFVVGLEVRIRLVNSLDGIRDLLVSGQCVVGVALSWSRARDLLQQGSQASRLGLTCIAISSSRLLRGTRTAARLYCIRL